MVATVLAGVGAAASLAGAGAGLMSAGNGAKAARDNNRMQLANYLLQKRMADEQLAMSRAGSTDARGNQVVYDPQRGWVEISTPETMQRLRAADQEEFSRNTVDGQRSRIIRGNNFNRQLGEGREADAALAQRPNGRESLREVRSAMFAANAAGANAGTNAVRSGVQMNALRQGSGGETALANLGRRGLIDTRAALAQADLGASPEFLQRNNARRGAAANEYNAFATRASSTQDMPMVAPTIDTAMNNARDRARAGASGAGNGAFQMRAPQFVTEEGRMPVALAGIGQNIEALGRNKQLQGLLQTLMGSRTQQPTSASDMNGYYVPSNSSTNTGAYTSSNWD